MSVRSERYGTNRFAALRADALIVVLTVAIWSAAMMAHERGLAWALAGLVSLALVALLRRRPQALHVTALALLWTAIAFFFPASRVWPTKLLAPLLIYAALVAAIPPLRRSVTWLHAGRLDAKTWKWIAATVAISSAALVAWAGLTAPDLSVHLANIPDIPVWTYPLAALIFAAFNAAIEEAAFRGVAMQALDDVLSDGPAALLLQAFCFGAAHYAAGFPNGALGLAMTFVYGLMLGVIRRRSGGMLAPWTAHVAADLTIFAILSAVQPA